MRLAPRTVALVLLLAALFVVMWHETFQITGVTARVIPPQTNRPTAPAAPALPPLPMDAADINLFGRAHPVWSALSS